MTPQAPKKSSRRRTPGPRINAGREGTALILGGGLSLPPPIASLETPETVEKKRQPGKKIDAEFRRRGNRSWEAVTADLRV